MGKRFLASMDVYSTISIVFAGVAAFSTYFGLIHKDLGFVLSILFIVSAILSAAHRDHVNRLERKIKEIKKHISPPIRGARLTKEQFFNELKSEIKNAEQNISLMYLNKRSPYKEDRIFQKYIESADRILIKKALEGVTIERIILCSKENLEWISRIKKTLDKTLDEHTETRATPAFKFEISVYHPLIGIQCSTQNPPNNNICPLFSVQIFDFKKTYFVDSFTQANPARYFYLKSAEANDLDGDYIAKLYSNYFKELWGAGVNLDLSREEDFSKKLNKLKELCGQITSS